MSYAAAAVGGLPLPLVGNEGYRGLTNKKKPKYKCDKSEINFDVLWIIVRAEIPLHI